jgi:hypothetical protein
MSSIEELKNIIEGLKTFLEVSMKPLQTHTFVIVFGTHMGGLLELMCPMLAFCGVVVLTVLRLLLWSLVVLLGEHSALGVGSCRTYASNVVGKCEMCRPCRADVCLKLIHLGIAFS